jgi:AraC family transcriptional regulator of adaptative response / DNA-3-methyladenine glycosylase II
LRRLFDLDCRPDVIDAHLGALAAGLPGMRVPGSFDGFEIAVRAIVGQQVTVMYGRTILARIASAFGTSVPGAPWQLLTAFPSAAALAGADPAALMAAGITRLRAEAIIALAREIAAGRLMLDSAAPLDDTMEALRRIRGIGEWTVQYIAMRALGWPNALPDGDAVLKRRLGVASAVALREHAHQWEPWRSYATLHLWRQADAVSHA